MKKLTITLTVLLVTLLTLSSTIVAQNGKLGVVGKLFDKKEASTIFGRVIGSLTINVDDLKAALEKGSDYILFAVKDNQVVIRNERRQNLSSERVNLRNDETMYIYSKEKVKELLKAKRTSKSTTGTLSLSAASDVVWVEVRAGVLTLTYNDTTLEQSMICPPICFE